MYAPEEQEGVTVFKPYLILKARPLKEAEEMKASQPATT